MTPLERAAEALDALDCQQHETALTPWKDEPEGRKELLRDQARAVLKAIREPSERMVTAGAQIVADIANIGEMDPAPTSEFAEDASSAFRAMIDQALGLCQSKCTAR